MRLILERGVVPHEHLPGGGHVLGLPDPDLGGGAAPPLLLRFRLLFHLFQPATQL
jgi:hypothetical protein